MIVLLLFTFNLLANSPVLLDSPPRSESEKSYVIIKDRERQFSGNKYFLYGLNDIVVTRFKDPSKGTSVFHKLVKGGVMRYNEKGVYFYEQKVCEWKSYRNKKDKKTYQKSFCPEGFPISVKEMSQEKQKKMGQKFKIKLEIVDEDTLKHEFTVIKYKNKYEIIPYLKDEHKKVIGKDVRRAVGKRYFEENPEARTFLNELIECFTQNPFCMSGKEIEVKFHIEPIHFPSFVQEGKELTKMSEEELFHVQVKKFFEVIKDSPENFIVNYLSEDSISFRAYTGPIPKICDYHDFTMGKKELFDMDENPLGKQWAILDFGLAGYVDSMPSKMGCK